MTSGRKSYCQLTKLGGVHCAKNYNASSCRSPLVGYQAIEQFDILRRQRRSEPTVPRQAFLPIWHQLDSPVHFLFLTPLLSSVGTTAGYVEF